MVLIPGLVEKVAAGATLSLLRETAGFVRRKLGPADGEAALRAAVAAALTETLARQDLAP